MIFEIDNVELYFAEKQILNGIYLKAETGKITGILGSNGSGKSSLLKIFFGSLTPSNKLIRIDKKPFLKPLFTSEKIKYLSQDSFLPKQLTLSRIFQLFEVGWNDFTTLFDTFSKYKNNKIDELSGGERRVVETFLILKSKAEIVLLDEPFSHITPVYIDRIKDLMREEKNQKAVVITDHMYRHIIDVTDDLYLLKNGCTHLLQNPKQLEDYKYLNVGSI